MYIIPQLTGRLQYVMTIHSITTDLWNTSDVIMLQGRPYATATYAAVCRAVSFKSPNVHVLFRKVLALYVKVHAQL